MIGQAALGPWGLAQGYTNWGAGRKDTRRSPGQVAPALQAFRVWVPGSGQAFLLHPPAASCPKPGRGDGKCLESFICFSSPSQVLGGGGGGPAPSPEEEAGTGPVVFCFITGSCTAASKFLNPVLVQEMHTECQPPPPSPTPQGAGNAFLGWRESPHRHTQGYLKIILKKHI